MPWVVWPAAAPPSALAVMPLPSCESVVEYVMAYLGRKPETRNQKRDQKTRAYDERRDQTVGCVGRVVVVVVVARRIVLQLL